MIKTTLITIGLLAFALGVRAQSVNLKGTESVTQTNLTRNLRVPYTGDPTVDRANREVRMTTTTEVLRHTLTFQWRGKTFTVADDDVRKTTTNTQQQVWADAPDVAAKIEAAKAARATKGKK